MDTLAAIARVTCSSCYRFVAAVSLAHHPTVSSKERVLGGLIWVAGLVKEQPKDYWLSVSRQLKQQGSSHFQARSGLD